MQTDIRLLLTCVLIAASQIGVAQKNTDYILANIDTGKLAKFAQEQDILYRANRAEALRLARLNGWDTTNLQGVDLRGMPIYHEPTNYYSAVVTKTDLLRSNLGVEGSGMVIGLWEALDGNGASPLLTHQDFQNRVTYINSDGTTASSHATHVAGTLIGNPYAAGAPFNTLGMAPAATIRSYSSSNAVTEMAFNTSMLVSNHSYGVPAGWIYDETVICNLVDQPKRYTWNGGLGQFVAGGDDPNFGRYDNCRGIDEMVRLNPFHLPVYSSGNYNSQTPSTNGIHCNDKVRLPNESYADYDPAIHPPGNGSQRSTVSLQGNAKNSLTVGNITEDYELNGSSSRGMTDDGRIKPDICGRGTNVNSAVTPNNDSYGFKTGTSMAAPNVAGSLILLQEAYENANGNNGTYMRAATLKGLAIHTADDLGNTGPDVAFGWGVLNANRAGTVITDDANQTASRILEFSNVTSESDFSFYSNGGPIKVTLCYTDREGTDTGVHNDPTPKLVNDLDLRLIGPHGPTYYPYILDLNNPGAPASTGDNDRDNVEQVSITFPVSGIWTVQVNLEGNMTGESQPYSLIVSGISPCPTASNLNYGNGNVASGSYFGNTVTSTGTVANGSNVTYQAVQTISLQPGFQAQSGSLFRAVIVGCP